MYYNHKIILFFSFVVLIILIMCSLSLGGGNFTLFDLHQGLSALTEAQKLILFESRIPRTLAILLSGSSTALAAMVLQLLVRNNFVEPSMIGSTEGAGLGLLLITIFYPSAPVSLKITTAIMFASIISIIFICLVNKLKYQNLIIVPLIGIMLSGMIAGVATTIAYQTNLLTLLSSWMLGDFAPIISGRYEILIGVTICIFLIWIYAYHLTILGFGKDIAINLGVNYYFILLLGLILVSMITAINIVVIGALPFLGIVVPNLIFRFLGMNLKYNILIVTIGGAIFVLICDLISRLIIYPFEIPVSMTIGLIGGCIFLFMLFKSEQHKLGDN